jgi:hypothetical protein
VALSSYITSLIKFTDFPDDLIAGNLFCNTWKYFDRLEKDGIGDATEMTQSVLQTEYENRFLNRRYSIRLVDSDLCNTPIYCMFAYYSKKYIQPQIIKLPKSLLNDVGKYQYAVIITDVKEFLQRVNVHLPDFCYSPIHYINYSDLRGKSVRNPIISKDSQKFGHQQEFRLYNHNIAITRKTDFDIPGITKIPGIEINGLFAERFPTEDMGDIAIKVPITEIFNGIQVDLKIDWNFCHIRNLVKNQSTQY